MGGGGDELISLVTISGERSINIIHITVKMFERILPQSLIVILKAKRVHYSVCMSKCKISKT